MDKHFTYAGRLRLLISVIFSMQTCWFQPFIVLEEVIKAVIKHVLMITDLLVVTGQCIMSRKSPAA